MRKLVPLLVTAVLLSACGGDDGPAYRPPDADDVAMGHVHGLGVNPADGALFIATHHGLFRADGDEREATLVGDSRQDTMGFTVLGPDEFLASGHPDARSQAPPLLGLIRSSDAGRTWTPLSLEGEADFHAIEMAGDRFYAHDATSNRFFEGRPSGRGLHLRTTPPGTLIDLAVRPERPEQLTAVTDRGLYTSDDGGRRWTRQRRGPLGLVTHLGDDLVLVDGAGTIHKRQGAEWTPVGKIGGPPAALAADGKTLLAAVQEGAVLQSEDGGRTWSVRVRP